MKFELTDNLEKFALLIYADYLKNIEKELQGVIADKDIEYLHRMRVATRRLRAAGSFFADIIKTKKILKSQKKIKKLTRLLGPRREKDVKVQYLKEQYKSATEYKMRAALKRYISVLIISKNQMYPSIKKYLENLAKKNFFALTLHYIDARLNEIQYLEDENPQHNFQKNIEKFKSVFSNIQKALQEITEYEIFINNPDNTHELHQMRIKIKKIRYTIEIINLLFENHFDDALKILKELQTILGDIHDADVWLHNIPFFLKTEKKKILEYFGDLKKFEKIEYGIKQFASHIEQIRNDKITELLVFWQKLKAEKFNELLLKKIENILADGQK